MLGARLRSVRCRRRPFARAVGVHLSLAAHDAASTRRSDPASRQPQGLSTALNAKITTRSATRPASPRTSACLAASSVDAGQIEQVREAAYLHDIGKIVGLTGCSSSRAADAEELELMRQHPASAPTSSGRSSGGAVAAVRPPPRALGRHRGIRTVSPATISGDRAGDVRGRLLRAMSLHRPYRRARTYEDCVAKLQRCRGEQFDPAMTDAFLRVLGELAPAARDVAPRGRGGRGAHRSRSSTRVCSPTCRWSGRSTLTSSRSCARCATLIRRSAS